MDLLGNLLGGQQRQEYDDFASRYERGAPWDGISDDESVRRFDQIAPNLSRDDFEQSAQQSFERLDPQQRAELGRYLQQRAPQYADADGDGRDDRFQDPRYLAQVTGRMQQEQPGLLGQLLGGGGGGGLLGGGGSGGSGGSGGGGMLGSPIAKAALAGIAAMAFRKMTSGR